MRLVTESGLYKLVLRSDKPEAKEFQHWVTSVVLPAIRKDGAYIEGEERASPGQFRKAAITVAMPARAIRAMMDSPTSVMMDANVIALPPRLLGWPRPLAHPPRGRR